MEVCRVDESAPVRKNIDDRQQEIWQWIGNTNSTSELLETETIPFTKVFHNGHVSLKISANCLVTNYEMRYIYIIIKTLLAYNRYRIYFDTQSIGSVFANHK